MKEDASSEYMYLDLECRESLSVQGKYLCMKYFVQLSVYMAVYLSVPFCLLCMHKLYMYIGIIMWVIHCWNTCTDLFVIVLYSLYCIKVNRRRRRRRRRKRGRGRRRRKKKKKKKKKKKLCKKKQQV